MGIVDSMVPAVVERHAEEAAFLWILRDDAVTCPQYGLDDLAKLDGRVDAQLDGLRIAGELGWRKLEQQLRWHEPGELFAAAVVALESGEHERILTVLDAITDYPCGRAVVSAQGWLPYTQIRLLLDRYVVGSASELLREIAVASCAIHRQPHPTIDTGLSDDAPRVRARALRALGELGLADRLDQAKEYLADQD